jgi:hypothetical protein
MHSALRAAFCASFGAISADIRILYGGSVKPDNAAEILAVENVDGVGWRRKPQSGGHSCDHTCFGAERLDTPRDGILERRPPLRARVSFAEGFDSFISPVAILATVIAAPITSAGRFRPWGPRRIKKYAINRRKARKIAPGN